MTMKHHILSRICVCCLLLLTSLTACQQEARQTTAVNRLPAIMPDYTGTVLPPNIAPVNFRVLEPGNRFFIRITGAQGEPILIRSRKSDIRIPEKPWHALLEANRGGSIDISVFVKNDNQWHRYAVISNDIAEEEIDSYLSYRLIEPSYVNYSILGIYQRCLENYKETPIYTTTRQDDLRNRHCINCHTFQNHSTDEMFFHVRGGLGGTIFVHDGQIEKVNTKTDSTLSACVYPSYHPFLPKIAFSTNETRQTFHSRDIQKVEVVDFASDLVIYDIEKHEIRPILCHTSQFETFPTWAPDGRSLYFCCAQSVLPDSISDQDDYLAYHYQDIYYDLLRIAYDPGTDTFGAVDTVLNMSSRKSSISFPRVSPDGKYILLCISDCGNFSIWHKQSDLYLLNLEDGQLQALWNVNSPETESFHSWSSDGRWFVFSTRREDGNYTRPYFSYFDRSGQAHKPFALPQKKPTQTVGRFKSYNLPELMTEPVGISQRTFDGVITGPAMPAAYRP